MSQKCKQFIRNPANEKHRVIMVGGRTYNDLIRSGKYTEKSLHKYIVTGVVAKSPKKVKKVKKVKSVSPKKGKKASPKRVKKVKSLSPKVKKASPKRERRVKARKSPKKM